MKSIDINKKARIFLLYSYGHSCKEIGKDLGISHATVFNWVKKFKINRNYSECQKGRRHPQRVKDKMSNSRMGIELSIETRRKMSLAGKKKVFTNEHKENISKALSGRKLSEDLIYKLSCMRKGAENPAWKGGVSKINLRIRRSLKYRTIRKEIYKRDNYTCQECGAGKNLNMHHIKSFASYPDLRFEKKNLITLCESCHKKTDNYLHREKNGLQDRCQR